MRHSQWFVFVALAALAGFLPGCDCGSGGIKEALGLGRIVERGASGEEIESEDATIDWGAVIVNTRVERKVVITNIGSSDLRINEVLLSAGFPNAVFNHDIAPNTVVETQTEKSFSIFFEPKVVGTYEGDITLMLGDASNEKLTLRLRARGIEGGCTITPGDTADFGNVALGTSYVMMIKIANASELDWKVNVEKILEDADKGVFVFQNFTPGELTVPSHGEILVPVEFKPNHVGPHYAALSIPSPTMCQPAVLPLLGNGVEQVLECEPKVLVKDPSSGREKWECLLDFGFVNPNSRATGFVTFSNLGNSDIDLSGFKVVQDATKADAFAMEPADDGKVPELITLRKGEKAKVLMSFLPTLLGQYNGQLQYESTDVKRPSGYVLLQGTGGGPAIDTQPADRIDFGPVALKTYQRRRLTITNVGTDIQGTTDDNLKLMVPDTSGSTCTKNTDCASNVCQRGVCWSEKVAELEVMQGDPAEFAVEWPPADYIAAGIAAGQSADLKVKFMPASPGDKKALLKVYSNDPAKPVVVTEIAGAGATFPPCSYDVVPPQLNFGNVEVGKNLALFFDIRNKSTNPADECLVSTLGFTRDTSSAFTLVEGEKTGEIIRGGQTLKVPVRFAPKKDQDYAGAVEFYISSFDAPEGKVPMSGSAKKGCLLVAPDELDFGVIQATCSSRERTFTIYNVCDATQTIQSIELQQAVSQEFHIVQTPMFPYVLTTGSSVDFKVKYSPGDVGQDQSAISIKTKELPQPYVVPVYGRGDTTAIQTDVFAQAPQPKVDVAFVVDNSGSMSDEQASLGSNFDAFIKFALAQGVEYHIAVTNTGVDKAHGGNYSDSADANGCFLATGSNPKIITPTTPNAENVFKQNVNVGADGNPYELLIRPAYLALTAPNVTGCNAGFLRDEANLAVVLVSDAGDQDNLPVSFYLNAMFTIKGYRHKNMFSYSAIMLRPGVSSQSCINMGDGTEDLLPRTEQMVNASGGVFGDICDADWSKTLEKLGQNAFGYRTRFFLSNTPDVSGSNVITVLVDDVPYPATGTYGDQRWEYNSAQNAVDFNPLAVPEPGSTIKVIYNVACLH